MSEQAVEAIISKIERDNYRIGRVVINSKLIIRDSVKKINN